MRRQYYPTLQIIRAMALDWLNPPTVFNCLFHPLHRKNRQPLNLLLGLIRLRHNRMREAELGCLAQPLLPALHRPHLTRQPDLTEIIRVSID